LTKRYKEGRQGVMSKMGVIHLKYLGRDSWDRPVYEDDNGVIWKDVDPRADRKADLCTSVDNKFDREPDTGMKYLKAYQNVLVIFVPERDVW